jgi:hypothetical protein
MECLSSGDLIGIDKIKETLDDGNLTLHLTWAIQMQNLIL